MKRIIILICTFTFICSPSFGQPSKKDISQIRKVFVNEASKGQHTALAREFAIDQFIDYYLRKDEGSSRKMSIAPVVQELYRDSVYTYFGLYRWSRLLDFLKVKNTDLAEVNYTKLDVLHIRKTFIDRVIPEADKKEVLKKEKDFHAFTARYEFAYRYIRETREIETICRWKERNGLLLRVIDKTYVANYNIDTKEFSKKSTVID
ncbi:hypothetical protein [Chitinophaga polysaccharea]|uniref:hypothetical protein n=1 Tax=Chitinophaga polysaccharea TaxID=1293035 RepID=UPI00115BED02|nr:hypothetical protein [Chitinophaga polysaccharea]